MVTASSDDEAADDVAVSADAVDVADDAEEDAEDELEEVLPHPTIEITIALLSKMVPNFFSFIVKILLLYFA